MQYSRTTTVGEHLQRERQSHGVTLQELSAETNIRREYLEFLESNEFEKLPSVAYVKGYIRTYADLLGFDHEPLFGLLRRDYKESARGTLVPRDFVRPALKPRALWTPISLTVLAVASVFIAFLSYVGYQWYVLQRPPMLEVTAPEDNATVAGRVMVTGQTVNDAVLTINTEPVTLQPDGTFSKEVFLSREGLNTISVEATDRRGKSNLKQRTVRVEF